jgi:hypothetical protein
LAIVTHAELNIEHRSVEESAIETNESQNLQKLGENPIDDKVEVEAINKAVLVRSVAFGLNTPWDAHCHDQDH